MVLRIFGTTFWIAVAALGVHMMHDPYLYEQWASNHEPAPGFSETLVISCQEALGSLGGIDTGRVLTIVGVCMIAGTWIPFIHRKRREDLTAPNTYKRQDERILLGDVGEDPTYNIRI